MTVQPILWLSLVLPAEPAPKPPAVLAPWVDYARAAVDTSPRCPPGQPCVLLSRVEVSGAVGRGQITLLVSGENLGRFAATTALVEPASTFAAEGARFRQGRGALLLAGNAWVLRVEPGAFVVEVRLGFEPAPSVPLRLPTPAAQIVDRLTQGGLTFDESSDRHGGVVFLASAATAGEQAEELSLRIARAWRYGSVVTFTYHFSVSGLKEQRRVELPRLGSETIEAVQPDIPYTLSERSIGVTLTPGSAAVEITGHLGETPTAFAKPGSEPFEYWLFEADPRHPVELETDGVEIDPGEVTGLSPSPRSRAFFVTGGQRLVVKPLAVTVDKGRQGAGVASVRYTQGPGGHWIGDLLLTSTTPPESDRIAIPTPAPPHYAESGGEAVRMFAEGGVLSLRVDSETGQAKPIRVQWREALGGRAWLSMPAFRLPGQSLHLEESDVRLSLLPGFVPIAVFGASHASGHLVDGLHIYAVLIALLGVAFARAARFRWWAVVIVAVLLAGLYTVEGFPRVALLFLLGGCAVLMRLPERALAAVQARRVLHVLLGLVWLVIMLVALIPSVVYVRDRVYSALHPWSAAGLDSGGLTKSLANQPLGDELDEEEAGWRDAPAASAVDLTEQVQQRELKADLESLSGLARGGAQAKVPKATEKTIRPVAFAGPQLPARPVQFSFGSLLPGDEARARVLLAGPMLRGAWMFVECAGLSALLALLIMRARRWWQREGVQ